MDTEIHASRNNLFWVICKTHNTTTPNREEKSYQRHAKGSSSGSGKEGDMNTAMKKARQDIRRRISETPQVQNPEGVAHRLDIVRRCLPYNVQLCSPLLSRARAPVEPHTFSSTHSAIVHKEAPLLVAADFLVFITNLPVRAIENHPFP